MGLRVEIDHELCISSGQCVYDEPDVFEFDDERLAVVRAGHREVSDERLIQLAQQCPGQAILLFDPDGEPVDVF